jgi:hypothetical protein
VTSLPAKPKKTNAQRISFEVSQVLRIDMPAPGLDAANLSPRPCAMLASPSVAAKARDRGLTVTERKRSEDEATAAAAAAETLQHKRTPRETPVEPNGLPMAACKLGRGRAAMNGSVELGGGVRALEERKQSALQAIEFRPTSKVMAVAPAGSGKLDEMPYRRDFEIGTDAGEAAFGVAMDWFLDKNFDNQGIEARSLDHHVTAAGSFGFWHEQNGHGKCVEWKQVVNGWELHALKNAAGELIVPTTASLLEFALLVRRVANGCSKRDG